MAKKKKKKKNSLGRRIMRWWPTRVVIELWMRLVKFWLTVFGWRWAYFWARIYSGIAWALMPRLRGYAVRNVDLCFPEKSEAERYRIARESFKHSIYSFMDYLLVPRYFSPGKENDYFQSATDAKEFLDWFKADEPGFNMTLHLGNFDICTFNIGQHPDHEPLMLIAKEVRPPLLNKWLMRARQALGNEVVHADEGARIYMRAIKQKRKCGTIVDQNGGDFAPVETFFDVPCTWQTDWTRLLLRSGAQLSYHACVRDGDKFKFNYLAPVFCEYEEDAEPMDIIRHYRDWVESVVRDYPEQYMWMHRRFKAKKKGWPDRYTNLGKRLTSETRAAMLEVPQPRPAKANT